MLDSHRMAAFAYLLLWLAAAAASPQEISYPTQGVKNAETLEQTEIRSYRLTRDHRDVDTQGQINRAAVEALDAEGKLLATCEVVWLEESKTMTCSVPDGNRYQATWFASRAEFRDLQTGDFFSVQVQPLPPGLEEPGNDERRTPTGQWELSGTTTWEDAERTWGHITPLFSSLLGEIEVTLGLVESRWLGRKPVSGGSQSNSQLPRSTPPSNVDFCPEGHVFCDDRDPCEISGVFAASPTICCSGASNLADDCCRQRTLESCCANSLCNSLCTLGIFCECFLDGWIRACAPPCT